MVDRKLPQTFRLVTCPTCEGDSVYAASNPFRPFCSDRCKNLDLGAWADEGYRVPATPEPDDSNLAKAEVSSNDTAAGWPDRV